MKPRILIVDDDFEACETTKLALESHGFQCLVSTRSTEVPEILDTHALDAIVTDVRMPETNGIELCRQVLNSHPDIPVIVATAFGSMETAVEAMRAGAFDFVTKPIETELLAAALQRACKQRRLEEKVRLLSEQVRQFSGWAKLTGESSVMQNLYAQLQRLAETDVPVLVTGESGTGKELAARALHEQSHRRQKPFVPVNCPALPEPLLESELFGHAAGAYTGAAKQRKGLFLQADGGTLFLDEVGDFPLALQPKLLRVLEERTVRQVGGDREVDVDVRIVAATNHDLEQAVHDKRFRNDLFYRINVVQIKMPPLRERGNDILLLAQHFLKTAAERWGKPVSKISGPVAQKLLDYNWPGNVRELKNIVDRAVALTEHDTLSLDDLPRTLARGTQAAHPSPPNTTPVQNTILRPLDQVERQHILLVLDAVDGNKAEAARILQLDRKTLYRKLQKYTG
jgi:DNA-binding NtrC family response regulator